MEDLGSMELAKLLQLFAGSLTCAFIVLVLLIVYVVLARRASQAERQAGQDRGGYRSETPSPQTHLRASPATGSKVPPRPPALPTGGELLQAEISPVDVSARLAGTGRDAWLEEASPNSLDTPEVEEPTFDHGREVLRLVRDPHSGQIWIQAAGMRYRSLNDIRDRAVGQRVLAAITYALRFSDGVVATDQGVVTIDLPPHDAVKAPTAFGFLSEVHEQGELLRLMSSPDRGHFCLHVAGQCYRRLADVSDQATGQYILEAITRLLQFSNGMLATNDGFGAVPVPALRAEAHTPLPATRELDSPSAQSDASAPESPAADLGPSKSPMPSPAPSAVSLSEEERFLQQLRSQVPSEAQAPIERPNLLSSFRRMRSKKPSAEPLPILNLADEIDRIFQTKLSASPLAATDARVETNPDGGIHIRVGMAFYRSPDEVPDPHLRDLLKLSIAEWERS